MDRIAVAQSFLKAAQKFSANDRARIFDFLAKFYENPARPGSNLEHIRNSIDKGMHSARVSRGIRAIVHRSATGSVLLYVDQHDDAYSWAAKRSLTHHPVTKDFQIVVTAEVVEQSIVAAKPKRSTKPLFDTHDDDYLVSLGVPEEWLPAIRKIRTEDQLLAAASHQPETSEIWEELLRLASGEVVVPPKPAASPTLGASTREGRRFWVINDASEIQELLDKPLADWIRFLHPTQRELAFGHHSGPVKVTGSAGTGKTVVILHRAAHLARAGKRVLLTSFVTTLCRNLEKNLRYLLKPKERKQVTVSTVHKQALALACRVEPVKPSGFKDIRELIAKHSRFGGTRYNQAFLWSEWAGVIEPQGIRTWAVYRKASRTGRGTGLTENDRRLVWGVYQRVLGDLVEAGKRPWSHICQLAREALKKKRVESPFDAVLIDEVQDLGVQEIQLLAALAGNKGDLMLVGDSGQSIYPGGFSLKALKINVTGRSHVLRLNYRTTEQIRRQADLLLPGSTDDLDGGLESRSKTRSLLQGPDPTLRGFRRPGEQTKFLVDRIADLAKLGYEMSDIAIFTRSSKLWPRIEEALAASEIPLYTLTNEKDDGDPKGVRLATLHRAKGLEFKAVFVPDCSSKVLPSTTALEEAIDDTEREEALARERHLLYVGMTRARDEVFLTWVGDPSPFLGPMLDAEQ